MIEALRIENQRLTREVALLSELLLTREKAGKQLCALVTVLQNQLDEMGADLLRVTSANP